MGDHIGFGRPQDAILVGPLAPPAGERPFAEQEVELVARIIETDGTVFVAREWGRDDDGFIIATGSFAGTQERTVTVLIPFRSVRRIVVEEAE